MFQCSKFTRLAALAANSNQFGHSSPGFDSFRTLSASLRAAGVSSSRARVSSSRASMSSSRTSLFSNRARFERSKSGAFPAIAFQSEYYSVNTILFSEYCPVNTIQGMLSSKQRHGARPQRHCGVLWNLKF